VRLSSRLAPKKIKAKGKNLAVIMPFPSFRLTTAEVVTRYALAILLCLAALVAVLVFGYLGGVVLYKLWILIWGHV
jgi:ABC-type maltose transport system permease subunit